MCHSDIRGSTWVYEQDVTGRISIHNERFIMKGFDAIIIYNGSKYQFKRFFAGIQELIDNNE